MTQHARAKATSRSGKTEPSASKFAGSSVVAVARHFGIDQSTLRRWVQSGCPTLVRGSCGPGCGSRFDLLAVKQWRGMARGQVGLTPDQVLQRLAAALLSALEENHLSLRAGISREAAAAALLVAWEQCCKSFGVTFRFDENPDAIRALMREL